jgi:hypothetical protein
MKSKKLFLYIFFVLFIVVLLVNCDPKKCFVIFEEENASITSNELHEKCEIYKKYGDDTICKMKRKQGQEVYIAGKCPDGTELWAADDKLIIKIHSEYFMTGITNSYSEEVGFLNVLKESWELTDELPLDIDIELDFILNDLGVIYGSTELYLVKQNENTKEITLIEKLFEKIPITINEEHPNEGNVEFRKEFARKEAVLVKRGQNERIFISGAGDKLAQWGVDNEIVIIVRKRIEKIGLNNNAPNLISDGKPIPDGAKVAPFYLTKYIPLKIKTKLFFEICDYGGYKGNSKIYLCIKKTK